MSEETSGIEEAVASTREPMQRADEEDTAEEETAEKAAYASSGESAEEGATRADSGESEEEKLDDERELAENNALADAFDDVRAQSADGRLVEPSRWPEIGLVPAHMTAEDFEMFAYDWLENYREEHADEIEAERAAERAQAAAARSATRAVGVPPKIPNRRLAQIEADERHNRTDEDGNADIAGNEDAGEGPKASLAPLSGDEPASEERPPAESQRGGDSGSAPLPSAGIADASTDRDSEHGDSTAENDASPFADLRIPEGYRLEQVEDEWTLVQDEHMKPARKKIECSRIRVLVGMHSYYLYDETLMTDSYAHWAFLAAEDNPVVTFVECVREDSRIYPRPYAAECLKNPPFRMNDEQIEETWVAARDSGNYPDIRRVEASNGDVYYYSTKYLSPSFAASLAEYDAVERPASV